MILKRSDIPISQLIQENLFFITLLVIWSLRIFWTIFHRWGGFPEQDWRLENMKKRYTKRGKYLGPVLYWTVGAGFFSFVNYKAMTLLLYNVVSFLTTNDKNINTFWQGILVMACGLCIESYADFQMF
jgi:steroid 5-alpha reductase family enzyme